MIAIVYRNINLFIKQINYYKNQGKSFSNKKVLSQ